MARSQEGGITTLLGLRNCKVGRVIGNKGTAVVEVEIKGAGR